MPWTTAYQAPPFVGFSRQEYCWVAIAFSSECLPRLFHVMVALGGTHLVQESHLRKAQSIGHLELKGSSSLRTWKENRDV